MISPVSLPESVGTLGDCGDVTVRTNKQQQIIDITRKSACQFLSKIAEARVSKNFSNFYPDLETASDSTIVIEHCKTYFQGLRYERLVLGAWGSQGNSPLSWLDRKLDL